MKTARIAAPQTHPASTQASQGRTQLAEFADRRKTAAQQQNLTQLLHDSAYGIGQRKLLARFGDNATLQRQAVTQLKLSREDALALYQYYQQHYGDKIDFQTWQPYHQNIVLANDDLAEAKQDVDRQIAALTPAPAPLSETAYDGGYLSGGGALFEHVRFSDGTYISFKRDRKKLRWVYMDVRSGTGAGAGFSVRDEQGYKGAEVKSWLAQHYPELVPHWSAYRANHPG